LEFSTSGEYVEDGAEGQKQEAEKRVHEVLAGAASKYSTCPDLLLRNELTENVVPSLTFKRSKVSSRVQEAVFSEVFSMISSACDVLAHGLNCKMLQFVSVTLIGMCIQYVRNERAPSYPDNCISYEQSVTYTDSRFMNELLN